MLTNNSPLEHLAAFAIVLVTGTLLGLGLAGSRTEHQTPSRTARHLPGQRRLRASNGI